MEKEKRSDKPALSSEEKMYSVFAYFGVLCLVSFLVKRDNRFVMFHVKQGMVLFIIETLIGVLRIIPVLGHLVALLVLLICGLLSLTGIIQALMGNKWDMPVVGEWAKKISV